jgi:hypothetical protein
MEDPIVQEVRDARQKHAARFGFDLLAIAADIKQQEQFSGVLFVNHPRRQPVLAYDHVTPVDDPAYRFIGEGDSGIKNPAENFDDYLIEELSKEAHPDADHPSGSDAS